jgi:hypothetical protein
LPIPDPKKPPLCCNDYLHLGKLSAVIGLMQRKLSTPLWLPLQILSGHQV